MRSSKESRPFDRQAAHVWDHRRGHVVDSKLALTLICILFHPLLVQVFWLAGKAAKELPLPLAAPPGTAQPAWPHHLRQLAPANTAAVAAAAASSPPAATATAPTRQPRPPPRAAAAPAAALPPPPAAAASPCRYRRPALLPPLPPALPQPAAAAAHLSLASIFKCHLPPAATCQLPPLLLVCL